MNLNPTLNSSTYSYALKAITGISVLGPKHSAVRHLYAVKPLPPGETVAVSGVYRVVHAQHRPDHEVLALNGDILPGCRVCGGEVRFYLEKTIEYASHDWDLAGPLLNSRVASE